MPDSPAPPTALVVERLRAGALAELVDLVSDWLLGRPIAGLVDPATLAAQAVAALRAVSDTPRTAEWMAEQLAAARKRVPEGTLAQRVPRDVAAPVRELLARPLVLDQALVRRMVDHDATRTLLIDVLGVALTGFAERIRSIPVPKVVEQVRPGGLGLGRLRKLGEGVLGGLSEELHHQAEGKVQDFARGAIGALMEQVALHLTSPDHAAAYGRYRVHLLDTLLATPLQELAAEVEKLDTQDLVDTGVAVVRAVARRPELEGELRRAVERALAEVGDRSVRDFLADAGQDEDAWRARVSEQLVARGQELLDEPAFAAWLDRLLGPAAP
jgi:hypothetical protein